MSAIAVRGIFMEEAKNAAPPTTANAPSGTIGPARFQRPPMTVASKAPIVRPGVSNPPSAPARRAPIVTISLRTDNVAAGKIPKSLSNPTCVRPLPLPKSCGKGIESRPISGNAATHHKGRRQPRGAWARAARVARTNQYAVKPNSGPVTIDQTTRDLLIARGGTEYGVWSPRPIQATRAATADVAMAGTK